MRHLHEDLPQDVREKYVLKGHFIGKTGHHIDRRLNKRDLLRSEAVLNRILQPMIRRIMSYRPTALLGQETAAALLVRRIGGAISIPAFSLPKTGDFLPPEDGDMSRAVLVEDNVITAQSIREALGSLRQAPATPIRAITSF